MEQKCLTIQSLSPSNISRQEKRSVCLCVCAYVCLGIRVCLYVCIFVCAHACVCVQVHGYVSTCFYTGLFLHVHTVRVSFSLAGSWLDPGWQCLLVLHPVLQQRSEIVIKYILLADPSQLVLALSLTSSPYLPQISLSVLGLAVLEENKSYSCFFHDSESPATVTDVGVTCLSPDPHRVLTGPPGQGEFQGGQMGTRHGTCFSILFIHTHAQAHTSSF